MDTPSLSPTIGASLRNQLAEEQAERIAIAWRRYRLLARLETHTAADVKALANVCEILSITPERVDADVRALRDCAVAEARVASFDVAANEKALAEAGEASKALQAEKDRLDFTAIPAALVKINRILADRRAIDGAREIAGSIRRDHPELFENDVTPSNCET